MSVRCTPFCRPCEKGYKHHEILIALLNTGENSEHGDSIDAEHELLEKAIIKYKSRGWDMNAEIMEKNVEFRFPLLHWACVLGKTRTVRWLLDHGFCPTVQTKDTLETCVHRALMTLPEISSSKSGRLSMIRFETILPRLHECLSMGNHRQNTPLHVAAQFMVQNRCYTLYENLFLKMLAEIKKMPMLEGHKCLNAQNSSGDTALNLLAEGCKSLTVIEKLMDAGADSMLTNKLSIGPLDNAERHGLTHIANFFKSSLLSGCRAFSPEHQNSLLNEESKKRRSERRSTYYSTMATLSMFCQAETNSLGTSHLDSPDKSSEKSSKSSQSEMVNVADSEEEGTLCDPSSLKNDDEDTMCQCCGDENLTISTHADDETRNDNTEPEEEFFHKMKEAGVLPNLSEVITKTKAEHLGRMKALEKSLNDMSGKQLKRTEREKNIFKEIEKKQKEIEKLNSELLEIRKQSLQLNNKRNLMEEESEDLRRKLLCCENLLKSVPKDTDCS